MRWKTVTTFSPNMIKRIAKNENKLHVQKNTGWHAADHSSKLKRLASSVGFIGPQESCAPPREDIDRGKVVVAHCSYSPLSKLFFLDKRLDRRNGFPSSNLSCVR
jgi:hypothetical protein